jgi:hypothetical protein
MERTNNNRFSKRVFLIMVSYSNFKSTHFHPYYGYHKA